MTVKMAVKNCTSVLEGLISFALLHAALKS